MIPAQYNITLYKNRDYREVYKFEYTIESLQFEAAINTNPLTYFSISKPDKFTLIISLNSNIINNLAVGKYKWDLKQISSNNHKSQIIEGEVNVKDTITP